MTSIRPLLVLSWSGIRPVPVLYSSGMRPVCQHRKGVGEVREGIGVQYEFGWNLFSNYFYLDGT